MARDINKYVRLGALTEKKNRMQQLEIKIDGLVKEINYNLFMDDGVHSIQIDLAKIKMKELEEAIAEFCRLEKEVQELE